MQHTDRHFQVDSKASKNIAPILIRTKRIKMPLEKDTRERKSSVFWRELSVVTNKIQFLQQPKETDF